MIFEWDARKAKANLQKHKVSFEEAATVFLDPLAITYLDPDHSIAERRETTIDHTVKGRLIFVAHCESANNIRIISARLVTAAERKQDEEEIGHGKTR